MGINWKTVCFGGGGVWRSVGASISSGERGILLNIHAVHTARNPVRVAKFTGSPSPYLISVGVNSKI
jgi:hypothetical protein